MTIRPIATTDLEIAPPFAIQCDGVGKAFQLYMRRNDQLLQAIFGRWKKFYKDHWVLRDVSFEVKRGECIGIIGRNGAGKTTLLTLLCGISPPTRGEIRILGRVAPILALGTAFDGSLTGRENAEIGCAVLGLSRTEIEARMQSIMDFAEIGIFFDLPMKIYSSGMAARLAFAVCTQVDADILIVDEAMSVGDEAFGKKCEKFIHDFASSGTIVVVSHGLDALVGLCDRVVWIENGVVKEIGDPASVVDRYKKTARPSDGDV